MRAVKGIGLALAAMLVLALVLAGAGVWLGTERGTQWVLGQLLARARPTLTVGTISGRLWERITLGEVELEIDGDRVEIPELRLHWQPRALLDGRLVIDELAASAVEYRQEAAAPTSSGAAWQAPLPVRIAAAHADRVSLMVNGQTRVLESVSGRAALDGTTLRVIGAAAHVDDPALDLTFDGTLDWADGPSLESAIDWQGEVAGAALGGTLELSGTWPELELHQRLARPFPARADGRITLGATPSVALDLEWTDLAWPGLEPFSSPSGRLHADGAIDAFSYSGEASLEVEGEPFTARLRGRGEGGVLEIEEAVITHAAGSVTASGEVTLDPFQWRLAVESDAIEPGTRFADWPGRIALRGVFAGRFAPHLEASFAAEQFGGELRDYPVHARGRLAYASERGWQLDAVELESGPNRLHLNGAIADTLDLEFAASAPELAALWPGLEGALAARGTLTGTLEAPRLAGELTASTLTFGDDAAEGLKLEGHGGLAADAPLALEASAERYHHGRLELTGLTASVAGTSATHDADIAFGLAGRELTAHARGGLEGPSWHGTLERAELSAPVLGDWRLTAPVALVASASGVVFERACLVQQSSSICGSARLEGAVEDRLELELHDLELALLDPLLPETVSLTGRYDGRLSLADLRAEPHGTLSVEARTTTTVRLEQAGEAPLETTLDRVSLTANLADRKLELDGALESREQGSLAARASITDVGARNAPIEGQLDVSWPDVAALTFLSPDIGEVGGALDVHVTVGGTVDSPTLEGRSRWQDGHVFVPRWGLAIEGIAIDATSRDGEALEFAGGGRVGDARLDVTGTTALDPRDHWPTEIHLRGDSILAVQLPEASIYVSPDLSIEARLPDVYASGTVEIPRAEIRLAELPAQAVTPSSDAVVHGVAETPLPRPIHLHSDLEFSLGDDVRYQGSGLMTRVTGRMRLAYESGRPADATGTLSLTGQYNAYGQLLDLERGQLLFTGPLDNPTLEVRAVKKIDQRTVGVELSGPLASPVTRVFSDPAASEADALSYLLFGRPLTGNGQEETATLQSAALAMGLQQALPAVQRIGESLGLDELAVQSTSTDAGALMAGKYLSRRVYVRYTYGLFNRIGGLLLRFRFNDRLSVETRSGDEKSMDLLYTVDKD